jgi:quinoprotein dehydrogenase-associated probable ABC transporter substrate-binding protein
MLLTLVPSVSAQEDTVQTRVLSVCQDPGNLPFSNEAGEGFENQIAAVLAQRMGVPLETYWYPQRMNVVRNTIRYKLPGQSYYRCDLLTGVPAGWGSVSSTRPYYRSTYVLVYPKDLGLGVDSGQAFLALGKDRLSKLKIGIYDRTPATRWMQKHGLLDQAVPYRTMNADPDYYPGRIIERDLVQGKIDVAVIWGPIGGYYARRVEDRPLVVIPLQSEPGVRFDYAIAMGVRHGESEWRSRVQTVIDDAQNEIDRILRDYGVPLVEEGGKPR